MVAISPQLAEKSAELRARHRLEFPILGDSGHAWIRRLGLVFSLPEDLRDVYRAFELDLPIYNGDETWELPLPARIVVDGEGRIRSIDADPDYTRRPEPEATLAVLRGLSRGGCSEGQRAVQR